MNPEEKKETPEILNLTEMKEKSVLKKLNNPKIILGSITVLVVALVAGVIVILNKKTPAKIVQATETEHQDSQTKDPEPDSSKKQANTTISNPLNGTSIEKSNFDTLSHRPLAVMIDNSKEGRANQKGVNKADIVYEAIVEGGWTRLMPIYFSNQTDFLVMPTRSVRMVFLDEIAEFNDIFIYHVGGAQTPNNKKTDAVGRIYNEKIKSLFFLPDKNDPKKDWTLYPIFDKDCEKKGYPDYNCKYQHIKNIYAKATEAGYETTKWEAQNKFEWAWKFDKENFTKSDVKAEIIKYKFTNNAGYAADWIYDSTKDQYLRTTGGQKHIDLGDNTQLWTNTIIVQKIPYKLNVDDKLRNIATTEGKGEAQIFMKGKVYDVTWKKDCTNCRTRYFDKKNGEEFIFAPGKIWISVNRIEEKVTYN